MHKDFLVLYCIKVSFYFATCFPSGKQETSQINCGKNVSVWHEQSTELLSQAFTARGLGSDFDHLSGSSCEQPVAYHRSFRGKTSVFKEMVKEGKTLGMQMKSSECGDAGDLCTTLLFLLGQIRVIFPYSYSCSTEKTRIGFGLLQRSTLSYLQQLTC